MNPIHPRQEHNKADEIKPVLKGVVNEKLLRQKDKDFAKKEDGVRQNYLDP